MWNPRNLIHFVLWDFRSICPPAGLHPRAQNSLDLHKFFSHKSSLKMSLLMSHFQSLFLLEIVKKVLCSFRRSWSCYDDEISQISFRVEDELQCFALSRRLCWNCGRGGRLFESLARLWIGPRMCSFESNSGTGTIWRRLWRFLLTPIRTDRHSCGCENV